MHTTLLPQATRAKLSKVLIVDDSAVIHQTYRIALAKYGCSVLSALSGQDGLSQIAGNPDVDLLIVDMYMPRMSGSEFIRKVREQEAFDNVSIIAVTSNGQEENVGETRRQAEGLLSKPLTSTEIHLEIGRLFPEAEAKT